MSTEAETTETTCGFTWSDPTNPCEYGTTSDHTCFNGPGCTGAHMCCDVVPPYVQDWIAAHADENETWMESWEAAYGYMDTDKEGDVSCRCCGVVYFEVS